MDEKIARDLWIERWKVAGPMLEAVQHEELCQFDWQKDWQRVDRLLEIGADVPNQKDPFSSGLVEQQRIFARARR